ncbi:MAG: DUF1987 domain-containing protein [Chlorobi bacterium]|nr:DUF1987 domain-containing protein [Chlorobiota bacterium]
MENILIEATSRTPYVNFDSNKGLLEIKGRAIPENALGFFQPLIYDWLDEYLENPQDETTVNIELEYFNTSSSLWISKLFKKVALIPTLDKKVIVNWYYMDEDNFEEGKDYEEISNLPFNMIKA